MLAVMAKPKSDEVDLICEFCNKQFTVHKRFQNHLCDKKRRWIDRDSKPTCLAFSAYLRFYKLTRASGSNKTHDKMAFINSRYYGDFYKLGKFLCEVKVINPENFIDYLIKKGIRASEWTSDHIYENYVKEIIFKEDPFSGIERSIKFIQDWAEQLDKTLQDFYNEVNTNTVVGALRSGNISPWLLYIGPKSSILLDRLDDSQLNTLDNILKPAVWSIRKSKYKKDCKQLEVLLENYGL